MNKNLILRLITLLLVLFNMYVIFVFSSENAVNSTITSKKITESILDFVIDDFKSMPENEKKELISNFDGKIRTLAHFSEYALLGFNFAMHFYLYKMSTIKKASLSFIGCSLYSIIDEVHQHFVPGRTFQFSDIVTDMFGSILGAVVLLYSLYFIKKHIKKPVVS